MQGRRRRSGINTEGGDIKKLQHQMKKKKKQATKKKPISLAEVSACSGVVSAVEWKPQVNVNWM